MRKKLIKTGIIGSLILLAISFFEIINIESYYEDQSFIGAPANDLNSIKLGLHLTIAVMVVSLIAFVYLIYLDNKATRR